jgi:hypothetical protein
MCKILGKIKQCTQLLFSKILAGHAGKYMASKLPFPAKLLATNAKESKLNIFN